MARDEQRNKSTEGFLDEDRDAYTDLATVESQRNDLAAEEFPEGPYGSNIIAEKPGKTTPWREDQRGASPYSFENRELHEGIDRGYPGDHETHDE